MSPAGEAGRGRFGGAGSRGFTLLELLVVLAIIGILASLSLPAIKGIGRSRGTETAVQQLVADLAWARARAINGRTTVHVVFVPESVTTMNVGAARAARDMHRRLMDGAYRSYGFFAERSVGDQPGRPFPQYLDTWKTLPDGTMIAKREFLPAGSLTYAQWLSAVPTNRPLEWVTIPFPTVDSLLNPVPHLAFGPEGGLVDAQGNRLYTDEYLEVIQGSILSQRDKNGDLVLYDVRESLVKDSQGELVVSRIRIDGFTGRAGVVRPELE